ncbi:MAG: response regulator [Nitrospirae bacterium]|nr:response regulator [Nitrospirota bacterium]
MMEAQCRYIAVIDDDASVGRSLCRLLRSSGLKAVSFTTGGEFIRFAMHQTFDCLILDIHMPGLDGFQVQDRLESMGIKVPIVFITALGDPDIQVKAIAKGAAGYLQKPFTDKALLDRITDAIKNSGRKCSRPGREKMMKS